MGLMDFATDSCSECAQSWLQAQPPKSTINCMCPTGHLPKKWAGNADAPWWGSTSHGSGVLLRGTFGRSQWKAILSNLGQNTTPAKVSSFTGITWSSLLPVVLSCLAETNPADGFPPANGGPRTPSSNKFLQSKGITGRFLCGSVTGADTTYPEGEVETKITCMKSFQFAISTSHRPFLAVQLGKSSAEQKPLAWLGCFSSQTFQICLSIS